MMSEYHRSVLLQEVLQYLAVERGRRYIDGTLGGGGHTKAILESGGEVLGIDVDEDAIDYARKLIEVQLPELKKNSHLVRGNFVDIKSIAQTNNFTNIDGILLDLGVSSHQLDIGIRGFSFLADGPLDMRMDMTLPVRAADLVNGLSIAELTELFERYGEETRGKQYAKLIVEKRKEKRFETTNELASVIEKAVGRGKKTHPATQIFQALRIAVNDELASLKQALPDAMSLLKTGGRLCVISFHSLEDRIVKNTFKDFVQLGNGKILTEKPLVPKEEEMTQNRRSRSAKLRVIEKI